MRALARKREEQVPDMTAAENLVNRYVDCWQQYRPQYTGIYEDNDFGCEGWQIFRSGFAIEEFAHSELCELSVLLIRSLRGQINSDHKIFWSWVSFISYQLRNEVQLFQDGEWIEAFGSLVHLLLAGERHFKAGPGYCYIHGERLKYVNHHLLTLSVKKHLLAAAHAFPVLEGLLRRKCQNYVGKDGIVNNPFTLTEPSGQSKPFGVGHRMNRIDDYIRLFEQIVTKNRGRPCFTLAKVGGEICKLYPSVTDAPEAIDEWRNDLIHGNQYWMDRVPAVLNLICLLVIDEVEPATYDAKLPAIKKILEWQRRATLQSTHRAGWDIFPPDLTR